MTPAIAIVGMACRYPDARSPVELWESVLAQRRAFRRLPPERLRLEDYLSADPAAPDATYSSEAAVIEGYEFDRVGYRVAGRTYRSADLAHWLALDVASQALADAGFRDGDGLPRETTGVLLGNTLTGEFSRANLMRLRWPYVRRVLDAALAEQEWLPERRLAFLGDLEARYKAPFPPVGEETLAGGLSNTIAGRICNHFDLNGGGYTVDGACATSLLSVATACSALVAGDLDVALAGGVDLSLDPFELVGFAKTRALAPEEMRVYDSRSAGFWPGEGCGFVVLMRAEDAARQRRHVYAFIRGWGISSDGSGGLTRPEVDGQLLALRRAYHRAGYGPDTVTYFEGHGTGTSVGDATELSALTCARREAAADAPPALIGSIKANIGHTKAAAGAAGLIKAVMALHSQILPPITGCEQPHPELTAPDAALRAPTEGQLWPVDRPLCASVSGMGFGGINAHLTLEGAAVARKAEFTPRERSLLSSAQDAELLLLSGRDSNHLLQQVQLLLGFAAFLSRAEVGDLAAELARTLEPHPVRAALVASSPAELARHLEVLRSWLAGAVAHRRESGVCLGSGDSAPRIGFLFPGQGSPAHLSGGALRRRFAYVRDLYGKAGLPAEGDGVATEIAQPAIVTASLAGLHVLHALGIEADIAVGHSLGEITALHWAGAFDEGALLRIAAARGRAMANPAGPTGTMASIGAGWREVQQLLNGDHVAVAGLNSPRQTVISGTEAAVGAVAERAQARGWRVTRLRVSHAFHSPLVAGAVPGLSEHLERESFLPLQRTVASTVTGRTLPLEEDLRALLCCQVTEPVRFTDALAALGELDLLIEVGPGRVLAGLASECVAAPVVSLDAGGPSLRGLLEATGAAFTLGAPVDAAALFSGRFTRPFDLDWRPRFFQSPCEQAPLPEAGVPEVEPSPLETPRTVEAAALSDASVLEVVRELVAQRAELPLEAVSDMSHLLNDLHLNSIAIGDLVAEAARRLGKARPVAPTEYAHATVAEVAQALESADDSSGIEEIGPPPGVDTWVRAFGVDLVERPLPRPRLPEGEAAWCVIAPPSYSLRQSLARALERLAGGGIVVCLPPEPDELHLGLLLEGAQAALAGSTRFVLVQHGGGAAAFARTLHLEARNLRTCVVDVPLEHPRAAEWVAEEAGAVADYSEAHYDFAGVRREPVLRLLPLPEQSTDLPLGSGDVLLVTGGGKGIAAECALALARSTGVRLALVGRSRPEADAELATNLERMTADGARVRYYVADVTDTKAVREALREVEAELGPVTALLHGAGTNVPQLLNTLDEPAFLRTLVPKVQGLRNVLAAVAPERLRLLVAFGSIIARTGLRGEADYGVANEWLARLVERFAAEHPACRALVVEWSVWSGAGMGERLGRMDSLVRRGITPITVDEGVSILQRLLTQPSGRTSMIVSGRFGQPPTLALEGRDLPFLRFLEHPRIHYPGVELVVDAELSGDTDLYLSDHVFQGERLFPAVMGLEAMAQVATALLGEAQSITFESVGFVRPVIVPPGERVTIRLAGLVQEPGLVEVALRTERTGFQVDHFHATCRLETSGEGDRLAAPMTPAPFLPIDPECDLYGGILFHTGRFKRLRGYRLLRATECLAEVSPQSTDEWFGRYLPPDLLLGDPGARDAGIHAVQACIPHMTLVPVGAEQLRVYPSQEAGPRSVHARERSQEDGVFTYDVEVTAAGGRVVEQWKGLRLQVIERTEPAGPWVGPLIAPYVERRLQDFGAAVSVAVAVGDEERRARSDLAMREATSSTRMVRRRPDGSPVVGGDLCVSAAHAGNVTLAVAAPGRVACDLEVAVPRQIWQDLLVPERLALARMTAREALEDLAVAATRVWAAGECVVKAGRAATTPIVLDRAATDGWVLLGAGDLTIATWAATTRDLEHPLVLAVLMRRNKCEPMSTGTSWDLRRPILSATSTT